MTQTITGSPMSRPARSRLSQDDFRQLMSCWSTGVAVVTSATDDGPVGCTVNAVTSVSLRPPLLLVSLAEGSRTLSAIGRRRRFGLNLLPAQRCDLARRFATGEPASRFAGVEYGWAEDVPVLRQVVTSAVCEIERCVTVADHVLVVAEPIWWLRDARQDPLVCFNSEYWSLWSMASIEDR
jgi:flavin reductase (DIM6/NTAB) family NADH-FMN oxidoreductase RutF